MLTCPSAQEIAASYDIMQHTYGLSVYSAFSPFESVENHSGVSAFSLNPTLSTEVIKRTSEMSFFFDSGITSTTYTYIDGFPPYRSYRNINDISRIRNNWIVYAPHTGTCDMNVVYWDGHAEGFPSYLLMEKEYGYDLRHPFFHGGIGE